MHLGLENLGRLIVGEPCLITRDVTLEQPFDHLVRLLPVRYWVRWVVAHREEGEGGETGGVVVCESRSDATAPIVYRKVRIRDIVFSGRDNTAVSDDPAALAHNLRKYCPKKRSKRRQTRRESPKTSFFVFIPLLG